MKALVLVSMMAFSATSFAENVYFHCKQYQGDANVNMSILVEAPPAQGPTPVRILEKSFVEIKNGGASLRGGDLSAAGSFYEEDWVNRNMQLRFRQAGNKPVSLDIRVQKFSISNDMIGKYSYHTGMTNVSEKIGCSRLPYSEVERILNSQGSN